MNDTRRGLQQYLETKKLVDRLKLRGKEERENYFKKLKSYKEKIKELYSLTVT